MKIFKKPDWKEVWEESKKYGKIEGPEKWALYLILIQQELYVKKLPGEKPNK